MRARAAKNWRSSRRAAGRPRSATWERYAILLRPPSDTLRLAQRARMRSQRAGKRARTLAGAAVASPDNTPERRGMRASLGRSTTKAAAGLAGADDGREHDVARKLRALHPGKLHLAIPASFEVVQQFAEQFAHKPRNGCSGSRYSKS